MLELLFFLFLMNVELNRFLVFNILKRNLVNTKVLISANLKQVMVQIDIAT